MISTTMQHDEHWFTTIADTGEECPWDNTPIAYGETVVAVSVVLVSHGQLKVVITGEEENDLMYPPQFYKEGSWSELELQIFEACPEKPGGWQPAGQHYCEFCGDTIREGEVVVRLTKGEIHRSQRAPNGESGTNTLEEKGDDKLLCTSCATRAHDDVIALWNEPVKQSEECAPGTINRCWRSGCSAVPATCMIAAQALNNGS